MNGLISGIVSAIPNFGELGERTVGSLAITILDRITGRAVDGELLDGLDPEDLIDPKDLRLFSEWMQHAAEIEATCLSVAAAGLAAELGMVDRELNHKIRESLARREATESAPIHQ